MKIEDEVEIADEVERTELDIMTRCQKAHKEGVTWKEIRWLVETIILPNLSMKVIAEKEVRHGKF